MKSGWELVDVLYHAEFESFAGGPGAVSRTHCPHGVQ